MTRICFVNNGFKLNFLLGRDVFRTFRNYCSFRQVITIKESSKLNVKLRFQFLRTVNNKFNFSGIWRRAVWLSINQTSLCLSTEELAAFHSITKCNYTPANSVTPPSRVLLYKPVVSQLIKKLAAIYGIRMFITLLTTSRHLSITCTRAI
jgi:hypothetical protein